jgi:hypothetical protein
LVGRSREKVRSFFFRPLHSTTGAAHDVAPPFTVAQKVPAQQRAAATSQDSPGCRQRAAPAPASLAGRQTAFPGSPPQAPTQQSLVAAQGAPTGAHEARQARAPVVSGKQNPEQHWSGSAQPCPSGSQVAVGAPWHRDTPTAAGRHVIAPMPQQSVLFWHRSPTRRQPMDLHRATPSGPAAHMPEQQLAATAHRSPSELQPPTAAQRMGPCPWPSGIATHAPEQQSMLVLQISSTTWHPGGAVQVVAPPAGGIGPAGRAMHWPLQQSPG